MPSASLSQSICAHFFKTLNNYVLGCFLSLENHSHSSIHETVCLTTQKTIFLFWQIAEAFQQFAESAFSSLCESTHSAQKVPQSEFQQFAKSTFSILLKVFASNDKLTVLNWNGIGVINPLSVTANSRVGKCANAKSIQIQVNQML